MNWNQIFSFPLKILLVAIAGIFFLGFTFGIMGNTSSKLQPQEEKKVEVTLTPTKQPVKENTFPPRLGEAGALPQQLKDCQNLAKFQSKALNFSSEIISISGSTIISIANGNVDVDQIEKDTVRVNVINVELNQVSDEAMPLYDKCFRK